MEFSGTFLAFLKGSIMFNSFASSTSATYYSANKCLLLTVFVLTSLLPHVAWTTDPKYTLVWADEFNKDGPPDPCNWTCERGFVRNQELQWYQPDNARCENGLLIIEGRRERVPNPNYSPGSRDWRRKNEYAEYTSACLKTMRRHQWKYGRFEMRARIDTRHK